MMVYVQLQIFPSHAEAYLMSYCNVSDWMAKGGTYWRARGSMGFWWKCNANIAEAIKLILTGAQADSPAQNSRFVPSSPDVI